MIRASSHDGLSRKNGAGVLKILLLQPLPYFKRLGISFENCTLSFCPLLSWNLISKINNCDVVCTTLDNSLHSRAICHVAKSKGKRTILFSDGNIDWANATFNPSAPNIQLYSAPIYVDIFYPNQNAKHILPSCNHWLYIPFHARPGVKGVNRTPLFLITTANTPYFNDGEYGRLLQLIEEVIDQLHQLKLDYVFRISNKKLAESLSIQSSKNFLKPTIQELLRNCTAVISTPSTVTTTSSAMGLPTACLDYRSSPVLDNCGWRLHKSMDLKNAILEMAQPTSDQLTLQNSTLSKSNVGVNLNEFLNSNEVEQFDADKGSDNDTLEKLLASPWNINLEYFLRTVKKKMFR